MKQFNVFLTCSLLVLVACSKQADVEQVSLEDVMPTAEREYQEGLEKDTLKQTLQFTLNTPVLADTLLLERFPDIALTEFTDDFAFFPDRLNYQEKWARLGKIDAMEFTLVKWTFADSVLTENAFFNWLDCFGENCVSMRVGQDTTFSQFNTFVQVNENELIYASSAQYDDLQTLVSTLDQNAATESKYILEQKGGKKSNWLVLPKHVEGTQVQRDF